MNLGQFTVSLTRVSDNKTVQFTENFEVHDDSKQDWSDWPCTVEFLWADGNYSCNCNRFLFFERALGSSEDEIRAKDPGETGDCGSYEKYRVNWIKIGEKTIYEETE